MELNIDTNETIIKNLIYVIRGRRYLPYAFTEQGISMLSAVLRSEIAVKVSVRIRRLQM